MSNLSLFMKKNKKVKQNTFYPATKSLVDDKGEVVKWELKALTTKEAENIRVDCTTEVQVTGKPGMYRPKVDTNKYIAQLLCAAVVTPDLLDSELQDSYGVKTAEDLLKELVDDPTEYNDFAEFVQSFNGLDESMEDKVEQAKN